MGLVNLGRRLAVSRFLKEAPIVGKLWQWLTDPAHSGRKRGLAAVLLAIAAAGRVLAPVIVSACAPPDPTMPAWACHAASLDVAGYMETLAAWLQGLDSSATAAGSLVLLWGLVDARRKGRAKVAGLLLAVLALGAGPARAQETPPADATVIEVETGIQSVVTRSDRRERASATATLDAPLPGGLRGSLRVVAAGEQDGSSPFELSNPRTFRDVEGCALVRKQLDSGVGVAGAGCVTWSIEGQDGPTDPRMYSALVLFRIPLPGSGYAYAGGGHRGPVGGWAASGTVAYQAGKARIKADYDLPLRRPDGVRELPWVLKTQMAIPLKRWIVR